MNPIGLPPSAQVASMLPAAPGAPVISGDEAELKETFEQFVGEAFFGQLLKAMRSLTDKPAFFHGGQAEEIFQRRLDELLAEKLADSSSGRLAEPMYELFALGRK